MNILLLHDLKVSENIGKFRKKDIIFLDTKRIKKLFDQ
jgi:hypothetical protein